MTHLDRPSSVLIIAALMTALSARGQQPPDVVTSDGNFNTAMGSDALLDVTKGSRNTAAGDGVLQAHSTGYRDTALGYDALSSGTDDFENTATGVQALFSSIGTQSTAFGAQALYLNRGGYGNSAAGAGALAGYSGTENTANTAYGANSLLANTGGNDNTAAGASALQSNTTGSENTAFGYQTLYYNSSGSENTGVGINALYSNTTGSDNSAFGYDALYDNLDGTQNIAFGVNALYRTTSGNNNTIGNEAIATDSGIIRIGTSVPTALQTQTYIAGIYGNTSVSGLPVVIDSNGQLGVVASTERIKTAIAPIGSNAEKLGQLRPVTFRLTSDPDTLRYGLIAEEVAQVYPGLVIRDAQGRIDGVRYDELAPLLLHQIQRQQKDLSARQERHAIQIAQIRDLSHEVAALSALEPELRSMLAKLRLANDRKTPPSSID
jgi:hypothetical protein